MKLLPNSFRALIIGSSGTIGAAFMQALQNNPACIAAIGVHRNSEFRIDYQNPETIKSCAEALSKEGPFQLIINTIGVLHSESWSPEKRLDDLNSNQLIEQMKVNAIGPALTIKHFAKLLDPAHGVMATISAKVGSIEDNRLGGWYSYRASKAALNMLIKTAAIELTRSKPNVALVALHPGTVESKLSKPFGSNANKRPASDAARDMLTVITQLEKVTPAAFFPIRARNYPGNQNNLTTDSLEHSFGKHPSNTSQTPNSFPKTFAKPFLFCTLRKSC